MASASAPGTDLLIFAARNPAAAGGQAGVALLSAAWMPGIYAMAAGALLIAQAMRLRRSRARA